MAKQRVSGTIKNFNQKGGAIGYRQRPVFPNNGGDPAPIRARLSRGGGISGARIKVTNPAMAGGRNLARTRSMGMGGVGQRGRNMDF